MENVTLMAVLAGALVLGLALVVTVGGAIYVVFRQRLGVTSDLELSGRQDRLESQLKMLRDEWESYRSNLDTIVRRGIRLNVLEGRKTPDAGEPAPAPAPLTRADLLKRGALADRYRLGGKKEVNE